MNIPNFINAKIADKDGNLTPQWKSVLSQLFTELQSRMSEEGHIVPSQTTENIAKLNTPDYAGGLLYDTDTDTLKVNIAGTIKTITTS